jgi:hypothetical protein
MTLLDELKKRWMLQDQKLWGSDRFGDESLLAQVLRNAPDIGLRAVADELDSFANRCGRDSPAQNILRGLVEALLATEAIRHGPATGASHLMAAIECFDETWNAGSTKTTFAPPQKFAHASGPVRTAFGQLKVNCTPLAYWVVFDLVDRWFQDGVHEQATSRSASTTLLGAIAGEHAGRLLRLTVDLIPCQKGTFCPDPWYLALTAINLESSLLDSMERIWVASRLSNQFRGRWRIENPPTTKRAISATHYPSRYSGRSAEAATMCALLAASGDPYCDLGHQSAEPDELDLTVAISAQVNTDADATNPVDLPLGKVESEAKKLKAALSMGNSPGPAEDLSGPLDSVVFARETGDNKNQRRKQESSREETYGDIRIERAATVAEALDLMLVTNRYLKNYRAWFREEWLLQWKADSGKAADDELPWNRELAAAARKKREGG